MNKLIFNRKAHIAAKSYGRTPDDVHFMRLGSSRGFATMLVDAKTGEVVGPVNVDP